MVEEKICPYNYPKGYKPIADGSCHYCEKEDFKRCETYISQEEGLLNLEKSKLIKK